MKKFKNNNKGFSLVELIVVIAIMAVLIGVLAPQFIKFVEQSRESTDIKNCDECKTAVVTYLTDNEKNVDTITLTFANDADVAISATVASGTADNVADALSSAKLEGTRLKSKKWKGSTTWTYTVSTATWTAGDATSTYYDFSGSKVGSGS